MFLKNPRLLFKSSSFRLITWYTVLFVLSSLIINIYIYTVISSFIYEQSRSEIKEDLGDLAEIYERDGVEAFRKEVFEDEEDPFLVRLMRPGDEAEILRVPKSWEDFDERELDSGTGDGKWAYARK
ncbi:MAG TPA: hypothetical protein VJV40_09430, partial [Thermodesulfobacteriota bacterium]|nr:hypothetical protein [Thermodesulfobacteriota bacterium]